MPPEVDEGDDHVVAFLTTEHFTLASARAAAVAETNGRLQLYIGALSSSIVALALIAQISDVGSVFHAFAFVLLPVNYFLGLATLGRLSQTWTEWFRANQGMNRIRHYFLERSPQIRPYLVMPATDDPWTTLSGVGIGKGRGRPEWWGGAVTAGAIVAIINSVVAGVLGALVGDLLSAGTAVPAIVLGILGFVLSFGLNTFLSSRGFFRRLRMVEVRFPAAPADEAEAEVTPPDPT